MNNRTSEYGPFSFETHKQILIMKFVIIQAISSNAMNKCAKNALKQILENVFCECYSLKYERICIKTIKFKIKKCLPNKHTKHKTVPFDKFQAKIAIVMCIPYNSNFSLKLVIRVNRIRGKNVRNI